LDLKINKLKSTLAFFAISPVVGFLKPLFVSILDDQAQFGNYTLVIVYSVWFSYVINSGIYEGLLKRYAQFFEEDKKDKINTLNNKISSFWLLLLVIVTLFISFFAAISSFYFFSAGLLLSFSTVSFNVYCAKYRVLSNIFRISFIQLLRLTISLLITYTLILNTNFGLDIILFIDALVLCFISILIFLPSFVSTFSFKRFTKDYFEIALTARNLTYVSALRALCLVLERQTASFLFEDVVFSQYAQILLLFQAMIVGFGLVPQLWQQNIMYWTLKKGVQKALIIQSYCISLLLFLWIIFWLFISLIPFPFIHPFLENMNVILLVGCAGVVYGASFIDSILLGTKRIEKLVPVYISVIFSWLFIIIILIYNTKSWSLEYQAGTLLLVSLMIIIAPSIYIIFQNTPSKSNN
jgi:hypothetical protein